MSEFRALSLSECVDELLKLEHPVVAMHVRPDGDTVGSGTALCEIFRALGKEATYICADPIPERLAFLTEGLRLAESIEGAEVVSIDVASPAQLGALYGKADVRLMIDHHAVSTPFAPHYTIGDLSSAGEVLFGIAVELERRGLLSIDRPIAERIYAAISSDTGGFIYSSVTPETLMAAARLISIGIDHAIINHKLFMTKPRAQLRAEGMVASALRADESGRICYATVSRSDREEAGIGLEHFECGIDVVRSAAGTEIAFIVKENDAGDYRVSLRSVGADVARIAALHGGGGHIRAAGCTVNATSIEEAARIILEECKGAL